MGLTLAKLAPASLARRTSAAEWHDTPTSAPGPSKPARVLAGDARGGQVHAVRTRGERDVHPIVHDEPLPGSVAGRRECARQPEQLAAAEILLAQLDEHPTGRQSGERGGPRARQDPAGAGGP